MYLRKLLVIPVLIFLIFAMTVGVNAAFEEGNMYHGFKLLEKRFVKEVNAECLHFLHEKSGARLLKIAAPDANKTFSITFKTITETSHGTPHILEHCVLTGSKKFPVKSPFDEMAKGSLNTFLNAFTGKDMTSYPVASMNNKDYFNLMNVYLDAVFYPRIYEDERILKQEGWHYELLKPEDEVVYKGVVYNEMKGAFSSATRELYFQIYKNLFPDNGYSFESGGYPTEIPNLTKEEFLNYHAKYYHPANSYIMLYGDADLDEELKFIDEGYLSHFGTSDQRVEIPLQKPFSALKKVIASYPVAEGSDTKDQTYLTLNIVAGLNTDPALVMALEILADVLVNHETAPVRLALQKAGIGKDVSAGLDDYKQNVFRIIVQNANPADQDEFYRLTSEAIKKAAKEGLDKKAIAGILNRNEFRLREGNDAQKGITYSSRIRPGWFFANDPFIGLEYEKTLSTMQQALTGNYLETVIENYLLENPHTLLVTLEPKPGMAGEIDKETDANLSNYKKSLSASEISSLVDETENLIAFQKREDTPEALATIPLLDISDINPEIEWYTVSERKAAGLPVLFHQEFTDKIIYINYYFDARVVPQEMIPYAALLTEMLGNLSTEGYDYGDLENELNINTGGFNTYMTNYLVDDDDARMLPKYVVSAKAKSNKLEKMFQLTNEILQKSKFNDYQRLKTVLERYQARLDSRIKQRGFEYAISRHHSYFSQSGMFDEIEGGMEHYWFVSNLTDNFDQQSTVLAENLSRVAKLLFTRGNFITGITCAESDLSDFDQGFDHFAASLPDQKSEMQTWNFEHINKNEGILTASKIQFVVKGFDYKQLGYNYDGRFQVLSQILRRDWLHQQLRVLGGAYGATAGISRSGQFYLASYRDPNLTETLANYDSTAKYLERFNADERTMTRYIIGTISRMDRPLTPSQKGNLAFMRYFMHTNKEEMQAERKAVLSVVPEDIRKMSKMVSDVMAKDYICVYGNEDKIKENNSEFDHLVELEKKKKIVQLQESGYAPAD